MVTLPAGFTLSCLRVLASQPIPFPSKQQAQLHGTNSVTEPARVPGAASNLPNVPQLCPDYQFNNPDQPLSEDFKMLARSTIAAILEHTVGDDVATEKLWLPASLESELRTWSRALAIPYSLLLRANLTYDLTMAVFGCSTLNFDSPAGPYLARNLDWWPEQILARASHLIVHSAHVTAASIPGFVGIVTALSGQGFGLSLNAVTGPHCDPQWDCPSVPIFMRHVAETAPGFEAAVQLLSSTPLMSPGLIAVVGLQPGEACVVERRPNSANIRWLEGYQPLVCTNNFSDESDEPGEFEEASGEDGTQDLQATSCGRYRRLLLLGSQIDREHEPEDQELLGMLADPLVRLGITAQHVIVRPSQRTIKAWAPEHFFNSL